MTDFWKQSKINENPVSFQKFWDHNENNKPKGLKEKVFARRAAKHLYPHMRIWKVFAKMIKCDDHIFKYIWTYKMVFIRCQKIFNISGKCGILVWSGNL